MSRIGKLPIVIVDKVKVSINDNVISVDGPNGSLKYDIHSSVDVCLDGNTVIVKPKGEDKLSLSMWGTSRTLINNMVIGVSSGFTKSLEFNGVGYKASVSGNTLNLSLGYSHPIAYELPSGIKASVVKNIINVSGADKALVGFVAAKVRSFRKPEPYKGKGVRYTDEVIIRKAGKSGAKK